MRISRWHPDARVTRLWDHLLYFGAGFEECHFGTVLEKCPLACCYRPPAPWLLGKTLFRTRELENIFYFISACETHACVYTHPHALSENPYTNMHHKNVEHALQIYIVNCIVLKRSGKHIDAISSLSLLGRWTGELWRSLKWIIEKSQSKQYIPKKLIYMNNKR